MNPVSAARPVRPLPALKAKSQSPLWFSRPIVAVLLLLPAAIATMVDGEHLPGVLLAYVNLVVIGGSAIHFARMRTYEGLIPVLFMIWMAMSWPTGSIFFALTAPDAYYEVTNSKRFYLDGNVRLQLAVLLFLVAFLPPQLMAIRRRKSDDLIPEPDRKSASAMAGVCMAMAITGIACNLLANLKAVPGIEYIGHGAVIYLNGLMFVIGVLFMRIAYGTRVLIICILFVFMAIYAIANSRSQAIQPILFLLAGILFISKLSNRWKNMLMVGFLIFFPIFAVVANTTRQLTGQAGGFENMEKRLELMSRWQEGLKRQPVLFSTMTRLFMTGGHSIITLTPDNYPHLGFDAERYTRELLTTVFVPGVLYYEAFYQTPKQLTRYDFYITDKTSVELSLIGSLWMIDGPIAVFIGGLTIGIINALVAILVARMRARAPNRALFVFAVLSAAFFWAPNYDFISYSNKIVRYLVVGHVLYFLAVAPFTREPKVPSAGPGGAPRPGRTPPLLPPPGPRIRIEPAVLPAGGSPATRAGPAG